MTYPIDHRTVGVDWLTATCTDPSLAERLADLAFQASLRLTERGWMQRPWAWRGYHGFSLAGMRYGKRDDGCIVVVSGEEARKGWHEVLHFATNVTRLDLAVTFHLSKPYPEVARICYEYLAAIADDDRHLPFERFSWITDHQRAETLYVGSRRSDQFGRLYDKGLESGSASAPGSAWRYEVEYKGRMALACARLLYSDYLADQDVNRRIASTVSDWFERRYVPCYGEHWAEPYTVDVEARVTDVDAKLIWLSRQVAPTIKRLFRAGVHRQRVEEALGLLDQARHKP